MPTTKPDVALFGETRPTTEIIEAHAGPVTFQFTDLCLRHIRLGDVELARRVYFGLRAADWDSVYPATVKDLRVRATRRSFEASWVAHCQKNDIDYEWTGCIRGNTDGTISFHVNGKVLSPFRSPRIGLNVLLGADTCAGRMFELTGRPMPQGSVRYHEFTRMVPRTTVAESLDSIRFCPADDVDILWQFAGSETSMEDQRNWAECTYKIFASMKHSYPELPEGQRGGQMVTLSFPRGLPTKRRKRHKVVNLHIGSLAHGTRMPDLGVDLHPDDGPLADEEIQLLKRMAPAHIRIRATMSTEAVATVKAIGCNAIVVVEDGSATSATALKNIASAGLNITAVECMTPDVVGLQRLRDATEYIPVGGPAAADFGHRPAIRAAADAGVAFLSWGIFPNMHLDDDETYLENARGPEAQLQTARYLMGHAGAIIGPVNLLAQYERPHPDPRQAGLLASAYAAGVLTCIGNGRATAGTFFRAAGVHGVIHRASDHPRPAYDGDTSLQVYPTYHLLKQATEWRSVPLRHATTSDPLRVTLLAVKGAVMVVNLTTLPQEVCLRGLGGSWPATVRTIGPTTFDLIRHGSDPPPTSIAVSRGRVDLHLEPCEVAFLTAPKGPATPA